MSRTLAVISATSLILCGVFFGLARMVGGEEIFHDPKSLVGVKPLIDLATHKEWRWDGGDSLALDGSVDIRYQAGGPPRVTVTGDPDLLSHVRVSKGRIVSDRKAEEQAEERQVGPAERGRQWLCPEKNCRWRPGQVGSGRNPPGPTRHHRQRRRIGEREGVQSGIWILPFPVREKPIWADWKPAPPVVTVRASVAR